MSIRVKGTTNEIEVGSGGTLYVEDRTPKATAGFALMLAETDPGTVVTGGIKRELDASFDYRLRVVARDIADFERVLRRRIMTLPGVGQVEANVLLTEERRPGPLG